MLKRKELDYLEKWKFCLGFIKERIPEQAYQTWFDDAVMISSATEEEVTLQVPNQFHYEWLESKYRHLIDDAIKEYFNIPMVVNYSVVISNKSTEEIPKLKETEKTIPTGYHQPSQLNSRYIFDNFIEGKDNQFAKAAAHSVADTPGQTPFNPLLIYSNPGLGKTHLLQAIGNQVLQKKPNARVVYITSEKFMQEFISAIQKNRSTDFAQTYRNVDMLLLDDAQFFQNKEQTQEQFFHLFNDLYQRGKQIVLTTDRHPNELRGIKDRLVSRFQSGLIVDIQAPDLETRIAILSKQAEDDGLDIPHDVTEFIAFSVKHDVRRMKAVLIRLLALSSIKHIDITMEMAKQVLVDMLGKSAFNKISINHVVKYVGKAMKISERQLFGKGRKQNVALARQTAMFLARELTDLSLTNIGARFGGRDHSTVIHACKTIENKINSDATFAHTIENMKSEIS